MNNYSCSLKKILAPYAVFSEGTLTSNHFLFLFFKFLVPNFVKKRLLKFTLAVAIQKSKFYTDYTSTTNNLL